MPLDQLAAYGAGVQVHVEDLAAHIAAHIAGRERRDMRERWAELLPTYQALAARTGAHHRSTRSSTAIGASRQCSKSTLRTLHSATRIDSHPRWIIKASTKIQTT